MEFLKGSKQEFLEFINHISSSDRVAILTHGSDLDGLASGIFLEEIFKEKKIQDHNIWFVSYNPEELVDIIPQLKEQKFSKVILMDLAFDNFAGFDKLRKEFDVLLIDHHPIQKELKGKGIIKTSSSDCVAWVIYNLGEGIINQEKWKWLVSASLFTEFSYENKEKMNFLKKDYPNLNEKNILDSELGKLGSAIAYSIVFYKNNIKKVYDLIKSKNLKEIQNSFKIISDELERLEEDFKENSEFFSKQKIYFYEFISKFELASLFSSTVSVKEPDSCFIIYQLKDNFFKISSRCQSGRINLDELIKKGINGLEGATGGWHFKASGAVIKIKDLNVFKENILKA